MRYAWRRFAKDTNAAKTKYSLISHPDSSINIKEDDPRIKGLVKYSSDGGGDISLKILGFRKRVHTKNSKRCIEIDEIKISNLNNNELLEFIRGLISSELVK